MSSPFEFVTLGSLDHEAFVARIDPEIGGAEELLRALYYMLWFPGYFGFNWNALEDCLSDLSWIPQQRIHLVHSSLPRLPAQDLMSYLEVLRDVAVGFAASGEKQFKVIFPAETKADIESILLG